MHASPLRTPALAALILAACVSLSGALPARADANSAGTGVARVAVIGGNVAIARGGSQTTTAAVLNAPILGGDQVTTGPASRAEIEFDGTATVRLSENVRLGFARFDDRDRHLQLAAGTIDLRLFDGTGGTSSIDTPSIAIVPRASGSYRVNVSAAGTTELTVRSGRADVITPQGTQTVAAGTTLVAIGAAADPGIRSVAAIAADGFDAFNHERDVLHDRVSAAPYADRSIDGVGELDAYGRWVADGGYGHVWIPANVAAGWAPYRDGRWVWADGFGWTWVAAEPWGWAPYHYGRWYYSRAYRNWAWYPPPAFARPAWSPALVAFIGFGSGNVGWVPLAPYEPFSPWWRRSGPMVVNTVTGNTTTITTITPPPAGHNAYRNMLVHDAVTGVTTQNFEQGHFDRRIAVPPAQLQAIHAVRGALPAVPPAPATRALPARRAFAGTPDIPTRTPPFAQHQPAAARATAPPVRAAAPAPVRVPPPRLQAPLADRAAERRVEQRRAAR